MAEEETKEEIEGQNQEDSLDTKAEEPSETSEKQESEQEIQEEKTPAESEEVKAEESEAEAEKESTDEKTSEELEDKKKKLLEKASQLKEKVDSSPETEDLKKQVKVKKRTDMLVPLEEYVKSGIYLGVRAVTPDMKPFVYRRRADGLAIFNTDLIDEKLKESAEYLSTFDPEDVIVVCKREAGRRAVEKFAELTGIRAFTKKYPPGILTNPSLENFFENKLSIITDAWLDRNALRDTLTVHKKVLMICDTNNFSRKAHQVIIGNNKSAKSLGLIYYILAREYLKAKGKDTSQIPELEWWIGEKE